MTPGETVDAYVAALEATNADLRAEVASLKRLLGVHASEADMAKFVEAFCLTHAQAWLLATLYSAGGHVVSRHYLMDEMPPKRARNDNVMKVHLSRVRKAVGGDPIKNVWGRGYGLTAEGMATCRGALGA